MGKPIYTIVLDELELLLNGTIKPLDDAQLTLCDNNDYRLTNDIYFRKTGKYNNPTFNSCYNVIIQNQIFAQLYYNYNSRYRYLIEEPILVHIENNILYTNGLVRKLESLLQSLPDVEFVKYNSVHIAIDGYDLVRKHSDFVKSKQYQRKATISKISITHDEQNNESMGYSIGSKVSDKYLSMYYKEQEIPQSGKYYIIDFWRRNGLIHCDGKSIDRVEGRLSNKELATFSNEFKDLENTGYLAGFFKLKFEKYLVFSNKKNKCRHLLNWNSLNAVEISKESITKKATDKLGSIKITLHTLFTEYLSSQDKYVYEAFMKIVRENNLIDWACRKALQWKNNY